MVFLGEGVELLLECGLRDGGVNAKDVVVIRRVIVEEWGCCERAVARTEGGRTYWRVCSAS